MEAIDLSILILYFIFYKFKLYAESVCSINYPIITLYKKNKNASVTHTDLYKVITNSVSIIKHSCIKEVDPSKNANKLGLEHTVKLMMYGI